MWRFFYSVLYLFLLQNEELTIVGQINSDWFEGRIGGQSGFVPANFIKVVKEPDSSLSPEKMSPSQRQGNCNNMFRLILAMHNIDLAFLLENILI